MFRSTTLALFFGIITGAYHCATTLASLVALMGAAYAMAGGYVVDVTSVSSATGAGELRDVFFG